MLIVYRSGKEHAQLEEQIREIKPEPSSLTEEADKLEKRNKESEALISEKTTVLEQEKTNRETYSSHLSGLQLECAALDQQLAFTSENEKRVNSEIQKLKEEDASLEEGKKDSRRAIEEKEARIKEIQEQIHTSSEDNSQLEERIHKISEEKNAVSKQQKIYFK